MFIVWLCFALSEMQRLWFGSRGWFETSYMKNACFIVCLLVSVFCLCSSLILRIFYINAVFIVFCLNFVRFSNFEFEFTIDNFKWYFQILKKLHKIWKFHKNLNSKIIQPHEQPRSQKNKNWVWAFEKCDNIKINIIRPNNQQYYLSHWRLLFVRTQCFAKQVTFDKKVLSFLEEHC